MTWPFTPDPLPDQAQVIGQVTDVLGVRWDVREARPTPHGWPLLLGWPHGELLGGGRGCRRVIVTTELDSYIRQTRLRDVDLPVGDTTVQRLRKSLGLQWNWDAWWAAREQDLRTLTLKAFAACHGCSVGAASQRRKVLLGSVPDQPALTRRDPSRPSCEPGRGSP